MSQVGFVGSIGRQGKVAKGKVAKGKVAKGKVAKGRVAKGRVAKVRPHYVKGQIGWRKSALSALG